MPRPGLEPGRQHVPLRSIRSMSANFITGARNSSRTGIIPVREISEIFPLQVVGEWDTVHKQGGCVAS